MVCGAHQQASALLASCHCLLAWGKGWLNTFANALLCWSLTKMSTQIPIRLQQLGRQGEGRAHLQTWLQCVPGPVHCIDLADCHLQVQHLVQDRQANGVIMAYGISGAGKTFTIEGTKAQPGVVPQALALLFEVGSQTQAVLALHSKHAGRQTHLLGKAQCCCLLVEVS